MRLVFIHGINEEHKSAASLRQTWETALLSAWSDAGLPKPRYALEMPYYGNRLATLAQRARHVVEGISHSRAAGFFNRVEHALMHEFGKVMGFDAAHLSKRLAEKIVSSDIAECEWVQAVFRMLDSDIPGFSPLLLRFTRQVDAYLTSPRAQAAVDDIVGPSLLDGPTVIVAHSLGSVIEYRLLRHAEKRADVPLFVTLGSPLGICTIKEHLNPPSLAMPPAVRTWLNATDERDCVALHACLDRDTFVDGIENVANIHHATANPYEIADYLRNAVVARRIHDALSSVATRRGRGAAPRGRVVCARTAASPRRTPA
jgi:hypothetical protein